MALCVTFAHRGGKADGEMFMALTRTSHRTTYRAAGFIAALTTTALLGSGIDPAATTSHPDLRGRTISATSGQGDPVAQAVFHPGSRGLGDSYLPKLGNGGYDVRHYGLHLSYNPRTHHLGGSNRITALATQNLSRFDLDLTGYRVHRVTVDGAQAEFRRVGQELVVTPDRGLPKGQVFVVRVWYSGVPRTIKGSPIVFGSDYGWRYTPDGAFVGCEPNAAHTWYPSNDHPSDKARFSFAITVPSTRKVVANGDLVSRHRHHHHTTFVWDEPQPMSTYLATLGIGRWQFHRTTTAAGIPEFTAVDPRLAKRARQRHVVGVSGQVTDFWSRTFGRYPFSSTGAIVDHVRNVGFSLETQTRPIYGFAPDEGTISHELAHQWFGDSVSVSRWKHIWLNEGFATFASWLWFEHRGGATTWRDTKQVYNQIPRKNRFWRQSIADPQRNTMFSGAVYVRGAMTLGALRHKIGRTAMRTLLRTWAAQHRHGTATTQELIALANQVSGQDLTPFFRAWLWRQHKPALPAAKGAGTPSKAALNKLSYGFLD